MLGSSVFSLVRLVTFCPRNIYVNRIGNPTSLNNLSPQILAPIVQLKSLRLWLPRGENPNELVYFNAVKKFMEQQKARLPVKV